MAAAVRLDRWLLPGELARAADPEGAPPVPGPAPRTARDRLVDVSMFAVAVLVGAAEFPVTVTQDAYHLPLWLRVLDPVVGGLLCLGLWWRRRHPVALGVAAAGAAAVSNTATGAVLLLLFSLAVHRGWTAAVPTAAASLVLGLPYLLIVLAPTAELPAWGLVLIVTLALGFAVAAGLVVRARRQLVLVLRERAEDARRAAEHRLADSRRAERERIAREMHDVLAHRISLLSVHAGALEYRTAPGGTGLSPAEVHDAAGVVRAGAHLALEELREVLHVLRDPAEASLAPKPGTEQLTTRLTTLLDEARRAGQPVRAELGGGLDALRPPVQRTVYRIVQEGLTNARKHAPGAEVQVRVQAGEAVTVEIGNALGEPGAAVPGAGVGLAGLADRVALHGGELTRTADGGRFRLSVRMPS